MHIIFDDSKIKHLFAPLSLTRHVADIRVGLFTLRQKWEQLAGQPVFDSVATLEAAHGKDAPHSIVNAAILPTPELAAALKNGITLPETAPALRHAADVFLQNDAALRRDIDWLRQQNTAWQPLPPTVTATNPEQIFIEPGATLGHCHINASAGPVYIAAGALVMDGALLRGPLAVCQGAVIKMGAKIYGATTIGPYCTAGGEIKNSVLLGYSNKAHDGYLGDSVIGEWCNLGAGTSNSNIKNSAANVQITLGGQTISAGNKCGLLMGDYTRSAINTSFNTGTVAGVCCNIFGSTALTPSVINNFSWGLGGEIYRLEKAFETIDNWKRFKGQFITPQEKEMLTRLYEVKSH
jgi:UDP-N-acetylglucosamine diphosphorylase / glucose-1-phosphate thymidylyltransferase / UDP-N-acetylgalactosamine diphosphorylase / glucosamine-1-phosphate N-acetyltransferase / galactosamine-1-phosphate N-acetyltransferase